MPTFRSIVSAQARELGDFLAFRYRSLEQLFKWLVEEDELDANPHGADEGTPRSRPAGALLSTEQRRTLLATCSGNGERP